MPLVKRFSQQCHYILLILHKYELNMQQFRPEQLEINILCAYKKCILSIASRLRQIDKVRLITDISIQRNK